MNYFFHTPPSRQPKALNRFVGTAALLATIILLLSVMAVSAQTWQWAKQAVGADDDYGNSIVADGNGNIYVTGYFFSSSIAFGSFTLTNTGPSTTYDVFVAKYDSSGNVLWAVKGGGTSDDNGMTITTDANGNVYVAGYFKSTATFGSYMLTSSGGWDVFLVKYDSNGNVLWAKKGGGSSDEYASRIATDTSGNVYITGDFYSPSITFGATTVTSAGGVDLFLVKYDSSGNILWVKREGATGSDQAWGLGTDMNGNVYISGSFSSPSITFGSNTLINAGGVDIFVTKYDASGNVLWANQAGGTGNDYGRDITASPVGNVFVTGYFKNTMSIGTYTLTATSNWEDIFIAGYSPTGNILWAKKVGGTNIDYSFGIASTDDERAVYITGVFAGTAYFDNIPLTSTNVIDWDIFAAEYDVITGNANWALSAGGTSNDFGNDITAAPAPDGSVYVTGYFCCTPATFTNTTLTNVTGEEELFVAKIAQPPPVNVFNLHHPVAGDNILIYPNPFNAQATLSYSLPENSQVEIEIYNLLGEKISTVLNEEQQAGNHELNFSVEESGIYFLKLKTENQFITKKVVAMK